MLCPVLGCEVWAAPIGLVSEHHRPLEVGRDDVDIDGDSIERRKHPRLAREPIGHRGPNEREELLRLLSSAVLQLGWLAGDRMDEAIAERVPVKAGVRGFAGDAPHVAGECEAPLGGELANRLVRKHFGTATREEPLRTFHDMPVSGPLSRAPAAAHGVEV